MAKRVGIEVSLALSEAVKMANADIVAAYPITPQTHIVEHLAELVAEGELDAEFIPVESEHSAMSTCIGSSASGARTFTATSAQGLALMHELLYMPPALRLPIVLAVANRAMSPPISIWNDHSDIMAERDTGWIQLFAENGQEVFDLTLQSFRIAEDPEVMLPVAVNLDGFTLSHVVESVIFPESDEVSKYLPPYKPAIRLDPENPVSMGIFGIPEIYTETKKATDVALLESKKTILKAWDEFGDIFGREYAPIETYETEGVDTILVTMGSISETAMTAVDEMRAKGKKVGLIKIRLWRPFPDEEFKAAVAGVKKIGVIDRCMTLGSHGGPVLMEIRSLLYAVADRPQVFGFMLGLGGRDATRDNFKYIYEQCQVLSEKGQDRHEMVGVME
ncbi:MAG: pyruvate ferredoxin oxidoreductase [Deltaproteobacteria bacterium]|nr:pyruvate ferredoxin oxidoreductase [Deltaproteobacteria bacterium]MBW2051635.1 pyruvate ferredoxin oxidoreductase [Deltaproteobacteria bacterium]MBW2141590.1 pyruvate ferredoxin oxidoreductase [Deltaproteobacteria bacterium]MBW2323036.1 pyruvate ferredoxin oxidoreductase [Deltaproteobacteria bacterium]